MISSNCYCSDATYITGSWRIYYQRNTEPVDCKTCYADYTFYNNSRFEVGKKGGHWELNESNIRWTFDNGTTYWGIVDKTNNGMQGEMIANDCHGTWKGLKQGKITHAINDKGSGNFNSQSSTSSKAGQAFTENRALLVGVTGESVMSAASSNVAEVKELLASGNWAYSVRTLLEKDATLSKMKNELSLLQTGTRNNPVFIYICAHGFIGTKDNKFYLEFFNDGKMNWLSGDELLDLFKQVRSEKALMVLEVCHSGDFSGKVLGKGKVIMTSAFRGETAATRYAALWQKTFKSAIFTHELVQAIKDRKACEKMTLAQAFDIARKNTSNRRSHWREVLKKAAMEGDFRWQTPQIYPSSGAGLSMEQDMMLGKCCGDGPLDEPDVGVNISGRSEGSLLLRSLVVNGKSWPIRAGQIQLPLTLSLNQDQGESYVSGNFTTTGANGEALKGPIAGKVYEGNKVVLGPMFHPGGRRDPVECRFEGEVRDSILRGTMSLERAGPQRDKPLSRYTGEASLTLSASH